MVDHERDDYRDGPHETPEPLHGRGSNELVRRIVANPDDESAWLAYSADLGDHGHDDEALVVRMLWPALRDSLVTLRSFDAVMADVQRNRNLLRSLAARQRTYQNERNDYADEPPPTPRPWSKSRRVVAIGLGSVIVVFMLAGLLTVLFGWG